MAVRPELSPAGALPPLTLASELRGARSYGLGGVRGGAGRGPAAPSGNQLGFPDHRGRGQQESARPGLCVRPSVAGRAQVVRSNAGRVWGRGHGRGRARSLLPAPLVGTQNRDPRGSSVSAPRAGRAERGGWGIWEGEPEGPPTGLPLQWHARTTSKWQQDDSSPMRSRG